MIEYAWQQVIGGLITDRSQKPRTRGVTMVLDCGMGLTQLQDLLEMAGHCIDHWKFGFGTTAFLRREFLQRKIALLHQYGILCYPGGTLLEVALLEQHCCVYMQHAKALGFSAVEISDGTITMPAMRRRNIIQCALENGLLPITEVGKKDPQQQPGPDQIADEALRDLAWGAHWVVIEGRESGQSVGIFADDGGIVDASVDCIAGKLGDACNKLVWEAPKKEQQAYLVKRFGTNVGLGNIAPEQILALEALRCRLRFESLQSLSDGLTSSGAWNPAQVEPHCDRV